MNYPTHDTNWATSAKGNDWRRINGKVLVVGKNKTGSYWAMIDGKFLINIFSTKLAAMNAANEVLMSKPVDKWSWE
jgi:hypothetical protein